MKKHPDPGPTPEAIENALHGHGPFGSVSRWLYKQRTVLEQIYYLYCEAIKHGDAGPDSESLATIDDLPEFCRPKSKAEYQLLSASLANMNANSTMMWALDSLAVLGTLGLKVYRPSFEVSELMVHTDLTVLGEDVHLPFGTILIEIPEQLQKDYHIDLHAKDLEVLQDIPEHVYKYLGYPPIAELQQPMRPRFVTLREMQQKNTRSIVLNVFASQWFRTDMNAEALQISDPKTGRMLTLNPQHYLSLSPVPVLGLRAFIENGKTIEQSFDEAFNVKADENHNIPLNESEKVTIKDLYRFALNSMLSLMMLDFKTKSLDLPKVARKVENKRERQQIEHVVPSELHLDQTIFVRSPADVDEEIGILAGTSGDLREMRPHWRRGHWRRVAVGKGRTDREYRFIKPVFVNLKRLTEEGYRLKDTFVEIKDGQKQETPGAA